MDFRTANTLPWLHSAQERLRTARASGHLPHSLLILSPAGLGALDYALWACALILCEHPEGPCGQCASCQLLKADSHPDSHRVRLEEEAKTLKVDQVRALIEAMRLKSYRGKFKVGLIECAEALNESGANAFLKFLEEPPADTCLILVAKPTHRLPLTVASRCVKVKILTPRAEVATAWLGQARPAARAEIPAALALAQGAPFLALELLDGDLAGLDREMHGDLRAMAGDSVDVTQLAERWSRGNVMLRLGWFEHWINARLRTRLAPKLAGDSVRALNATDRPWFRLIEKIHALKALSATGINQQLALEALLLDTRRALAVA
jgi:DNA polymerase III subunit delta'